MMTPNMLLFILRARVLVRAQRAGLKPIAVVGGATGLVGDPSGRQAERPLLDLDELEGRVVPIKCSVCGTQTDFGLR